MPTMTPLDVVVTGGVDTHQDLYVAAALGQLGRAGDRQANSALWRIVIVGLSCDQRTRDYVDKRIKEGKSKTEAIRCLKRYVAREIYNARPSTDAA